MGVVLLELLGRDRSPSGASSQRRRGGGAAPVSAVRGAGGRWTSEVFDLELMKDKGTEEEMVAMLQLALSCAAAAPEQRPKIVHVVKMIDEVRACGVEASASASHESSGVSSPAVSERRRRAQPVRARRARGATWLVVLRNCLVMSALVGRIRAG
ncbi:probable leucine-rich repeat receptor-like protein kinase At1g68400 [Miscanthus floridulus]|uniref:probable leucine-rich repeat receptor-like protein kinase At1g68400 n=1 Tax=Miscanthus floridulus TaxID=154761 RepID=UPI0034596DBB